MPVEECKERVSSAEFADWMAYNALEPFGQMELQLAHLRWMFYESNRDRKKSKSMKLDDFYGGRLAPKTKKKNLIQSWHSQFGCMP